ncbi:NAD(P)/FAD-dependent oxidoreductase [Ignicoccus hospitalis]|uniref:Ferredoxin--NADP reductase n=1 Tax=Ignicoccus hospitalis (strain KIN4/I / DSM 18386 / JCM 14125) TaxID=453591 RepID=FENR_IGNH4|nr:NAD(P)/FAD-dependent oxidoreductase [Ignicoccus hospitalis]A8AA47.1 RecName: Full=Ferredoxin--NADP reductase; Short=FNR; Short=Fd-NADP(+) reductase [Ignicoccus hospitalis KIN4/I]ABU81799.1 FAD-dependent pyridine nucleotide-disulphide oxidoreductase [Ignicoccus hospitalis KIN4/I]HIH90067.1 NAD(P)/FAD-dependent oxidoreductase [Desulfurococcaceae archaeon]
MRDALVVGAGPAGLTAAATLKQYGVEPLVIEAERVMATVYSYAWKPVENYPGFDGKRAIEIARAFEEMQKFFGVEVVEKERVVKAWKEGDKIVLGTQSGNEYEGKVLIIAIGILGKPRRLGIPNEDAPNVHYIVKDPTAFAGSKVVVVGGGDTAVDTATVLAESGAQVTIVHRRDQFRAPMRSIERMVRAGVKMVLNSVPKEIIAKDGKATALVVTHKEGGETVLPLDHLVISIGFEPPDLEWVKSLGVNMRGKEILVDDKMRTNVKGVFAAGDITPAPKRILVAAAQGYIAGFTAFRYIRTGVW